MLKVMMCGAGDTDTVLEEFRSLASQMGFEAWSYLDGTIRYRNSATGSWRENSRASVLQCDIAVFVIIEQYGEITWTEELVESIQAGLPLLVLCLDSTLARFREAVRALPAEAGESVDGSDELFAQLGQFEDRYHLTLVPFSPQFFQLVFQQHLTGLLAQAAAALRLENSRAIQRLLLTGTREPTDSEMRAIRSLALDDFEDKNVRKKALDLLAARGALGQDDVLALAASLEQGVARKSVALVGDVVPTPDSSFYEQLVDLVNESDDVGMYRRLVIALLSVELPVALPPLLRVRIDEVGTARRILSALIARAPEAAEASDEVRLLVGEVVGKCESYRTAGKLDGLASDVRELYGIV